MKTTNMHNNEVLARQYKDSSNLEIRKNFHKKYASSPNEYSEWILSKIKFFDGCRVLEVGCGTGNLWEKHAELVDTYTELVLTDISQGMTELVREKYTGRKNIRIQVMDVVDMPFEERSFDIIVANSMLYHVNEVEAALENIRRVLRDGGMFYATTFGKDGQISYIHQAMFEMGLSDSKEIGEISFSLENGEELLQRHFSTIKLEPYDAHLEVSEPADLVDYIFSTASWSHVDRSNREKMMAYFESRKDSQGIITIPMMYGMFIAS